MNENYDEAIQECKSLLTDEPTLDFVKITLAQAYELKEMFTEAIDIYKNLIIEVTSDDQKEEIKDHLSALLCNWSIKFYKEGHFSRSI